ncbi:MAG: TonB family protein [Methylococcaceae bacterium]|nr:TonB family protein [Methylococcaceae bacterium]
MFLCLLAAINNAHQAEVKLPQFVEVATIAFKPELKEQLSTISTQSQAQPLPLLKPQPVSPPVTTKPKKTEKPKPKAKPRVLEEASNTLSNKPAPDSHLTELLDQGNTNKASTVTSDRQKSTDGSGEGKNGSNGGGVSSGGTSNSYDLIVLSRVLPDYPPRARARGIQGWVQLNIIVTSAGTVSDARVVDASPKQIFDQAALEAIHSWRFKPAFKDGQPVGQEATLKLVFRLQPQR